MALVLIAPVLFVLLVGTGGGWAPLLAPAWTIVVGLVAAVGAATLATYVPLPATGREVGCTSCGAVAAITVLGAGWMLGTAPHQPYTALLALGMVVFGLAQRMRGVGLSCAASTAGPTAR